MSNKRPSEASWDSDEDVLTRDMTAVHAFPVVKTDCGVADDIDEDALLGYDEEEIVEEVAEDQLNAEDVLEVIDVAEDVIEISEPVELDEELSQDDGGGGVVYSQTSSQHDTSMSSAVYDQSQLADDADQQHDYSNESRDQIELPHLEDGGATVIDQADEEESESDDDERGRGGRGRFTSERAVSGTVISLKNATRGRGDIPDTLPELSAEDQARVESFMTSGKRPRKNFRNKQQRNNNNATAPPGGALVNQAPQRVMTIGHAVPHRMFTPTPHHHHQQQQMFPPPHRHQMQPTQHQIHPHQQHPRHPHHQQHHHLPQQQAIPAPQPLLLTKVSQSPAPHGPNVQHLNTFPPPASRKILINPHFRGSNSQPSGQSASGVPWDNAGPGGFRQQLAPHMRQGQPPPHGEFQPSNQRPNPSSSWPPHNGPFIPPPQYTGAPPCTHAHTAIPSLHQVRPHPPPVNQQQRFDFPRRDPPPGGHLMNPHHHHHHHHVLQQPATNSPQLGPSITGQYNDLHPHLQQQQQQLNPPHQQQHQHRAPRDDGNIRPLLVQQQQPPRQAVPTIRHGVRPSNIHHNPHAPQDRPFHQHGTRPIRPQHAPPARHRGGGINRGGGTIRPLLASSERQSPNRQPVAGQQQQSAPPTKRRPVHQRLGIGGAAKQQQQKQQKPKSPVKTEIMVIEHRLGGEEQTHFIMADVKALKMGQFSQTSHAVVDRQSETGQNQTNTEPQQTIQTVIGRTTQPSQMTSSQLSRPLKRSSGENLATETSPSKKPMLASSSDNMALVDAEYERKLEEQKQLREEIKRKKEQRRAQQAGERMKEAGLSAAAAAAVAEAPHPLPSSSSRQPQQSAKIETVAPPISQRAHHPPGGGGRGGGAKTAKQRSLAPSNNLVIVQNQESAAAAVDSYPDDARQTIPTVLAARPNIQQGQGQQRASTKLVRLKNGRLYKLRPKSAAATSAGVGSHQMQLPGNGSQQTSTISVAASARGGKSRRQLRGGGVVRAPQPVNQTNDEPAPILARARRQKQKQFINNQLLLDAAELTPDGAEGLQQVQRLVTMGRGRTNLTHSNRVVLGQAAGGRQVLKPSLRMVSIENLSSTTNSASLRQLCMKIGPVQDLHIDPVSRKGRALFVKPEHASKFVKIYNRKMVDLSHIHVELVSD
ncbi:uncharacterized protein LOC141911594 [Tubulanus polymorphus]|uniref:uncharacterized protein LOC141911594 n=1 Tax=Tubulanus polymorphus TaxID=672921 RepID=UPI003DA45F31